MVPLTSYTIILYLKARYSPMHAMSSHFVIKRFNDIVIYLFICSLPKYS